MNRQTSERSRRVKPAVRLVLLACLLGGLPIAAWAQRDQGVITGTITDDTGAVIPGAQVRVREINTNFQQSVRTNASGVYVAGPLRLGEYEVSVESAGFKRAVQSGIELHAGDRLGVDISLQVGDVVEVVEVQGAAPLLKTEQSSLDYVVETRSIEQLPLNGRNYQSLAMLTAGVVPQIGGRDLGPMMEGGHTKSGFLSHGQPAGQNNYIIDGIDNNSTVMGQQDRKAQAVVPSLDAVREFKVQTSNYSAEFGRNAGAIVNVTIKSGTNEFHGSAYEFLRNDQLDSRATFAYTDRDGDGKADVPILRQNQFGATIGGPVVKDRTFFFFSYEGWRVRKAQAPRSVVPTDLERAGDFSQTNGLDELIDPETGEAFANNRIPASRLDPVMGNILSLLPQPNFDDPGTRQNFLSSPPNRIDRDQFDVRGDHRFSERDSMFARFSWYDFQNLDAGPFSGIEDDILDEASNFHDNFGRHMTVSETHVFGPSLINEFRVGWKYLKPNRRSPSNVPLAEANERLGITGVTVPTEAPVFGASRLEFTGGLGFQNMGTGFFRPNIKDIATWQFVDNLTWYKGNHSVKFGADLRWEESNIFGGQWVRGGWRFNGRYTNISLGDALLGWTDRLRESDLVISEYRFQSYMFYVQDDWKVTPRLTLNLGLRYALRTPWKERLGRYNQMIFDPRSSEFGQIRTADPDGGSTFAKALVELDQDNFAPRIGFAWRPGDKWTVRSGVGIFYGGQMGLGAAGRPGRNFPFSAVIQARGSNAAPFSLFRDGVPAGFIPTETPTVDSVDDLPANTAFRTWDRRIPLPQTSQWNFTVQRQLQRNLALEVAYVGSATRNIFGAYDANDPGPGDPATFNARQRFPRLDSLQFRSPYGHASYHGMDVNFKKRYSSGLTYNLGYTWSHSIGEVGELFVGGDSLGPQDVTCFSCERGNASNDTRHRIVYSWIAELPFGNGKPYLNQGGLVDALFGGWQLSGALSAQTGQFFDATVPNKQSILGTDQGEWRANLVQPDNVVPANQGPDNWLNPEAFARPCDANLENCTFGNLGRNSLQEGRIFNLDMGLAKSFQITERFRLQFRAEAFNLTNTPSFAAPNNNIVSPAFGRVRSTNSTPRQLQMGLRLTW